MKTKLILTILRMAVGWHFLYEGLAKLFANEWTSEGYLNNTYGFLSGFYHWLAASPGRLQIIDVCNIYGLILIGLALFIGISIRWSALCGAFLLLLYYFAYPPFGVSLLSPRDGSVFVVDKIFIEAAILCFIFYYKEKGYGIDELIKLWRKQKVEEEMPAQTLYEPCEQFEPNTRREALKNLVSIPVLGVLGLGAFYNTRKYGVDVSSGATVRVNRQALGQLKGELPKGKLGNLELSRLIMGGNLMAGFSHSRDLHYVGSLFKAYNTESKVFETLILGEKAGINCVNVGFRCIELLEKYKKMTGSKITVICQIGIYDDHKDLFENLKFAIDHGMDVLQLQGNWCDWFVRDNKFDTINDFMEKIRSQGYIAGLCAHTIDSLIACEEKGIIPDYYMKTFHHDNYWSAHPRENRRPFEVDGRKYLDHNMFHDNCFDSFPDRSVEFVNRTKLPVIGFKTLAAGAIEPKDGFNWAFKNGADFICVGMFDFQIVEDINLCIDILQNLKGRQREWFA